jgi:HK97 family phage prohead protease
MSDLELKSFGPFEIKDATRGEVAAVVSSLDTVDHEREVIRSSAIKGGAAKVKISFYGHDAIFGEAPVGKGVITTEDGKGILRGNFFMSTTRGREAFETVKALGADGQWSIGFRVLKDSRPDEEWKAKGAERMIDEIELFEVSPVLRGASPNTMTLAVKQMEAPEPVAQADGDPAVEPVDDPLVLTQEKAEARDVEAAGADDSRFTAAVDLVRQATESDDAKAAREDVERKAAEADAQAKALKLAAREMVEEFKRVIRVQQRNGQWPPAA